MCLDTEWTKVYPATDECPSQLNANDQSVAGQHVTALKAYKHTCKYSVHQIHYFYRFFTKCSHWKDMLYTVQSLQVWWLTWLRSWGTGVVLNQVTVDRCRISHRQRLVLVDLASKYTQHTHLTTGDLNQCNQLYNQLWAHVTCNRWWWEWEPGRQRGKWSHRLLYQRLDLSTAQPSALNLELTTSATDSLYSIYNGSDLVNRLAKVPNHHYYYYYYIIILYF